MCSNKAIRVMGGLLRGWNFAQVGFKGPIYPSILNPTNMKIAYYFLIVKKEILPYYRNHSRWLSN